MNLFILIVSRLLRSETPEMLLRACLGGRSSDVARFVDHFTPVIRQKVRFVLFGPRGFHGRLANSEDVEDIVQTTFVVLFQDGARALRAYDAERGMGVNGYLGQIATREAHNFLDRKRAVKRGGGVGEVLVDPQDAPYEPVASPESDPEQQTAAAQRMAALEAALLERLSEKGRLFYRLLIVEELEVEEIVQVCQVDRDVVYTWRKRLKATLKEVLEELEALHETAKSG